MTLREQERAILSLVFISALFLSTSLTTGFTKTNTLSIVPSVRLSSSIPGASNQNYPWKSFGPMGELNPQNTSSSPAQIASGHVGDGIAVYFKDPKLIYLELGVGPGYAGPSSTGGVYKTTDGGMTWAAADFGLPYGVGTSIVMNQSNPNQLLVSIWSGIYRTDDGGGYWYKVSDTHGVTGLTMVNNTVFAGSFVGVIRSPDFGLSWSVIYPATWVVSVSISHREIYALQSSSSVDDVLVKSSDLGQTWHQAYNFSSLANNQWSVRASPSDSSLLYVALGVKGGVNFAAYRSTDGGHTFNPVTNLPFTAEIPGGVIGVAEVTFDPVNSSRLWIDGGAYEARSLDGGNTFIPGPQGTDNRGLVVDPLNDSLVWIGSDQGFYASENGGRTWTSLNSGLSDLLSGGLGVGENGKLMILDMQDYSPFITHDGGKTWIGGNNPPLPIADEGTVVYVNPYNSSWVYGVCGCQDLQVSSNSAQSFTQQSFTGPKTYLAPNGIIAANPFAKSDVYLGDTNGIYIGHDFGSNWQLWQGSPGGVTSFGFTGNNTMVVGTSDGASYYSNGVWSKATGLTGFVSSVAVDPGNTTKVFASTGYFSPGIIYRSEDSGHSFLEINSTLAPRDIPDSWNPLSLYVLDVPNNPVIASTAYGIFMSTNSGDTWVPISYNLHVGDVTGVNFEGGNLYISTWGGGVQEYGNFSVGSLPSTLEGQVPSGTYAIQANGTSIPIYGQHFKWFVPPGKYNLTIDSPGMLHLTSVLTFEPGLVYDIAVQSSTTSSIVSSTRSISTTTTISQSSKSSSSTTSASSSSSVLNTQSSATSSLTSQITGSAVPGIPYPLVATTAVILVLAAAYVIVKNRGKAKPS